MSVTSRVLALDVGGTKVLGGLVTTDPADLRVAASVQRPSEGVPGAADPGLVATVAAAAELVGLAEERGEQIIAVGAGFPEYVDHGLLTSSEVLAWRDQPGPMLAALVPGVPIAIESDVRCAAMAEYRAWIRPRDGDGAEDRVRDGDIGGGPPALGRDSMLYLSWGTGLSSTLVLDGACLAGARGEAIALGEWEVSRTAGLDVGETLEAFASGAGIARRYREISGHAVPGAAEVFALAARGDSAAETILQSAQIAVAEALSDAVAVLDPAVIVIGGGLGSALGAALGDSSGPLASRYRALTARRPNPPPLRRSVLGRHSGLIGAALAAAAVSPRGAG